MKITRLKNIEKKYFGLHDLARALGISPESARVAASRYVKSGFLIRLKRDLYVLADQWPYFSIEDKFRLANLVQSPSYISLMTALSYYQISTQMPQNFFESIALKRTKTVNVQGTVFRYQKIRPQLYFGFTKREFVFIAEPEKALLDAFYLMFRKRYTLDIASIDFSRFNPDKIQWMVQKFPRAVQKMVAEYELV
ncbi:MAG: hypothetical protein GXO78_12415 [Calditrichaeota bacterium]|nr:hypothetical protein [Calditrichota bacterium]